MTSNANNITKQSFTKEDKARIMKRAALTHEGKIPKDHFAIKVQKIVDQQFQRSKSPNLQQGNLKTKVPKITK
jgi:hypothetical protein